jgi:hypothetical protein
MHQPANKQAETPMQERERHARTREDVRDQQNLGEAQPSAKGMVVARDAIHQESQVGLAGSHYSHLSQVRHPVRRKVSWP